MEQFTAGPAHNMIVCIFCCILCISKTFIFLPVGLFFNVNPNDSCFEKNSSFNKIKDVKSILQLPLCDDFNNCLQRIVLSELRNLDASGVVLFPPLYRTIENKFSMESCASLLVNKNLNSNLSRNSAHRSLSAVMLSIHPWMHGGFNFLEFKTFKFLKSSVKLFFEMIIFIRYGSSALFWTPKHRRIKDVK